MHFGRAPVSRLPLAIQLAKICDSVPEIVYWAGPDGDCNYLNRIFYTYTGLVPGLPGDGWEGFVHPADIEPIQERFLDSKSAGRPYTYCFRLRGSDGSYHWFSTRSYPLHNPTHETAMWIGLSTDIDTFVTAQRERPDAWQTAKDLDELWEGDNAVFEVVDPAGQRSEVVCQFGRKLFESLPAASAALNEGRRWKLRKLADLPPPAFYSGEQILRVDRLVSLFSEVLSELGWPKIPLQNHR
jgi:PAS domain S-box-containing protein